MSSIAKLTRRFLGILALSTFLLVVVNFLILVVLAANQTPGTGPWTTAEETAEALTRTESGYLLSDEMSQELRSQNAWGIYIDNASMQVVWHTDHLPEEIPLAYTIADISSLTRGYVKDYPTFTASAPDGLVVIGFAKDRYWKLMNPSWDYSFIKNSPYIALSVIGINVAVIFLIYLTANSRLLRSAAPIAAGIQALPTAAPVRVPEKGLLSDLSKDINRTAEILQFQQADLRRKEAARANWISGVSHDMRTPLSMVMGYAGQLEDAPELSEKDRRKASIIRQQSLKMKNLINDLNLSSKLEYNMQPLHPEPVSLTAAARQCAADFLNADLSGKYFLEWSGPQSADPCIIQGDRNLLCRAVNNLLNNAKAHNPEGCRIALSISSRQNAYCITVEDDGIGITKSQLERLRSTPHYMMSDSSTTEPRHGLGLLIVQQIVKAHHGETRFFAAEPHGFRAELLLPRDGFKL